MKSICIELGRVELPAFSRTRVQMMPFRVEDPRGTVHLSPWLSVVGLACSIAGERGVGFLTIDEADVGPGEYHRRPGVHVDCGGPTMDHGGSPPSPRPGHGGSPPAPSPGHAACGGRGGMYVVSSHPGCIGYLGELPGASQGADGDCSRLSGRIGELSVLPLKPGFLYWCNHTFIHETVPATGYQRRQFARVSMPSAAPWHEDYTPSPFGVRPAGPIVGRRVEQMAHRPSP